MEKTLKMGSLRINCSGCGLLFLNIRFANNSFYFWNLYITYSVLPLELSVSFASKLFSGKHNCKFCSHENSMMDSPIELKQGNGND